MPVAGSSLPSLPARLNCCPKCGKGWHHRWWSASARRGKGGSGSCFGSAEPLGVLLALLAMWLVAGARLCLESVVGIPVRLVYALVGVAVMVLMCWVRWGLGAPEVWPRSSRPVITSALFACQIAQSAPRPRLLVRYCPEDLSRYPLRGVRA